MVSLVICCHQTESEAELIYLFSHHLEGLCRIDYKQAQTYLSPFLLRCHFIIKLDRVSRGQSELWQMYRESWGKRFSDGSACSSMAHGRMAGTCVMAFLIMQVSDANITIRKTHFRSKNNNGESKHG